MKVIKFDLPIDGVKVKDLNELRDHFTAEVITHYRSGLLSKWLRSRGFVDENEKVQGISADSDHKILLEICKIFNVEADESMVSALLDSPSEKSLNSLSDLSLSYESIAKNIDLSMYTALCRTCVGSPGRGNSSGGYIAGQLNIFKFDLSPYASDYVGDWDGFVALLSERELILRELAGSIEQPELRAALCKRSDLIDEIKNGLVKILNGNKTKITEPITQPQLTRGSGFAIIIDKLDKLIFKYFESELNQDQRDAIFWGRENLLNKRQLTDDRAVGGVPGLVVGLAGLLAGAFAEGVKKIDK